MLFLINGKTCYTMPNLLPALKEGDIDQPQLTAASPLLVTFPEEWSPIGLCCAAVVSLLSCFHVPQDAHPPEVNECRIHIKALCTPWSVPVPRGYGACQQHLMDSHSP